jgi:hypothetical protein
MEEMANLVEGSRSYEANLAAISIVKTMINRTLELGKVTMSDYRVYNDLPRMLPSPAAPKPQAAGGASFGKLLSEAIQQVNDVEKTSQGELQKIPRQ